jgi:hypothetical protein
MFIFIRLLLAHFIGDFPLQFNKIYSLKHKGLMGILPHALIIMGCLIILSWPYLNVAGIWGFILFVSIIHFFQDSIKVGYKGLRISFWLYLLDQFSHIVIIASVLLTNLKDLPPPKNPDGLIVSLYNNNLLVIYLIALIVATYNGYFLIMNFKSAILGRICPCSTTEKRYGMLERAALVSIFLLDKYLFFFISGVLLLRPLIFILGRKRGDLHEDFISGSEAILSWIVALIAGLCLFLIKRKFMLSL